MVGPFRLVLEKNAFGNGLYMPFRELWGYELLFYLKKCFCETPYCGGEGPGGRDGVRREGGSSQSLEARHGGLSGHQGPGGREDFSGRVHDVNEKPEERSSGQRSGGAMPGESYKEFKARREQEKKKKSAGQ